MIKRRNQKGFNLTEMAIVLAVTGTILGGVWMAASAAFETSKQDRAEKAIITIANNLRASAMARTGISGSIAELMPMLLEDANGHYNIFPGELIRKLTTGPNAGKHVVDSPWGPVSLATDYFSSLNVCAWQYVAPQQNKCRRTNAPAGESAYFAIEIGGLRGESCMTLATRISALSDPAGLVEVYVNLINTSKLPNFTGFPLSTKILRSSCYAKSGQADATLSFVYRLNPSVQ